MSTQQAKDPRRTKRQDPIGNSRHIDRKNGQNDGKRCETGTSRHAGTRRSFKGYEINDIRL